VALMMAVGRAVSGEGQADIVDFLRYPVIA
jgi:hypothetical protein